MCLTRFCCCCRLETIAILVGLFSAFVYSCNILSNIYFLTNIDEHIPNFANIISGYIPDIKKENLEPIKLVFQFIFTLSLVTSTINALSGILLMRGSIKEKKYMILPWLYSNGITLIYYGGILIFVVLCIDVQNEKLIAILASAGIIYVFQLYVWICIFSLFHNIRNSKDRNNHELV